jgi:excisionase family DNA binding protein
VDDDRFLTVPEVAERVRVAPETVRRWLRSGRLRGVLPGGTKSGWRIPESELRRFLSGAEKAAA